jgi:hypothetical protein
MSAGVALGAMLSRITPRTGIVSRPERASALSNDMYRLRIVFAPASLYFCE